MNFSMKPYEVRRCNGETRLTENDHLVVEEPLEIRVNGHPLGVVMRTPGHEPELARGFVLSEGILPLHEINLYLAALTLDVARDEMGLEIPNVINVSVPNLALAPLLAARRQMVATASCGICGRASLEQVRQQALPLRSGFACALAIIYRLTACIAAQQAAFAQTGGLHAAALFNRSGEILFVREDIGRHNAVDKVIGAALLAREYPLADCGLWVSGRLSFEMAQKALLAGIPCVAAVSAASSLAVDLARQTGMTLVEFLRNEQAVIYCGEKNLY